LEEQLAEKKTKEAKAQGIKSKYAKTDLKESHKPKHHEIPVFQKIEDLLPIKKRDVVKGKSILEKNTRRHHTRRQDVCQTAECITAGKVQYEISNFLRQNYN
jgi:hypothetical protein